MRAAHVFGFCALFGAGLIAALAEGNVFLALAMGAALGCAVAVVILAFPLDLDRREPPRGRREVHVVMAERSKK